LDGAKLVQHGLQAALCRKIEPGYQVGRILKCQQQVLQQARQGGVGDRGLQRVELAQQGVYDVKYTFQGCTGHAHEALGQEIDQGSGFGGQVTEKGIQGSNEIQQGLQALV